MARCAHSPRDEHPPPWLSAVLGPRPRTTSTRNHRGLWYHASVAPRRWTTADDDLARAAAADDAAAFYAEWSYSKPSDVVPYVERFAARGDPASVLRAYDDFGARFPSYKLGAEKASTRPRPPRRGTSDRRSRARQSARRCPGRPSAPAPAPALVPEVPALDREGPRHSSRRQGQARLREDRLRRSPPASRLPLDVSLLVRSPAPGLPAGGISVAVSVSWSPR